MNSLYLFNLAAKNTEWLSVRQAAIAGNIANANTAGYKAKDVAPFDSVLNSTQLTMTATRPGHVTPPPSGSLPPQIQDDATWEVMHSGNNVSLEQQLLKAGDVNRAYALNNNIMRAFHGMLMTSVRSA